MNEPARYPALTCPNCKAVSAMPELRQRYEGIPASEQWICPHCSTAWNLVEMMGESGLIVKSPAREGGE